MSYVSSGGRVWALPYNAEYLGVGADGVPLYFQGTGISRARVVTPRSIGRGRDVEEA